MPSVIPGYEYDIFVSYRHKDNRQWATSTPFGQEPISGGGWVTDFIFDLKKDLESTMKEDISIYYDSNVGDGLLESHDVDKSLEGKLKTVIFIPIVSQIYCDTRSFAWQNEFCAFNRMAQTEPLGRDIKLRNGNVASRILPVMIHQLDPEDRMLIENELKAKLRPIDFIFRSPGVNRPLTPEDKRQDSSNNLLYRDQVNKVANAIKEIITAIKYPDRTFDTYFDEFSEEDDASYIADTKQKTEQSLAEKSLAVLPFISLSHDASQEYFADGITENILIQLASLPELRVISRTSIMRYKKTDKTAPEIAAELDVKYILEGSAQAHGNRVRITVQLIDALKDLHIWSKVFVESMDDIFEIQNNVAEIVAKELKSSIQPQENEKLKEIPTKNLEAYDLFLKGRHAFNQWSVDGYRTASEYFKKAIEKDSDFKQAYSYLASSYSARMSWNGDLKPQEALGFINTYLTEAWKRGASDNDYLTKAFVEFFINKDFNESEKLLKEALKLGPNNAQVMYTYSYLLSMMGRHEEAIRMIESGSKIEPLSVAYFNYKGISQYLKGYYDDAITTVKEGLKLYPMVLRFYDHLSRIQLTSGYYQETISTIESGLRLVSFRPPSMLAYMAIAYVKTNNQNKATDLLTELLQRSDKEEKGVNLYVAHVYNALGQVNEAIAWLRKAKDVNDIDLIWRRVDPLLKNLDDVNVSEFDRSIGEPDLEGVEKFILEKLQSELPKELCYHNVNHTRDVVESVLKISQNENISSTEAELLRVAALFHDSGFTISPKNHEERGCQIAREVLPKYNFSNDQIKTICGMIMATKIPQNPQTNLEKILCDADLDYLGRDDFFETGKSLYQEMKEKGFVETEREWNLIQKTFLETHRYHTKFSKENREAKKQQHLQEIISRLFG